VKHALLALADGTIFEGRALGYEGETVGEVVFNTAMTGYQEILTDPSYKGQIITMTSPHIGNYGMTPEDAESRRIWAEGFIVKEASRLDSNWRSRQRAADVPVVLVGRSRVGGGETPARGRRRLQGFLPDGRHRGVQPPRPRLSSATFTVTTQEPAIPMAIH